MRLPAQTPLLDTLMIFCANWLIFLFPLILILLWGRPLRRRKRSLRDGEAEILQERRAVVLWLGVACLVAYGLNLLIEQFIFEPRPFVTHRVHLLIAHAADASFPSGHSAWAFAVAGLSRIFVGVHYPGDILGGGLIDGLLAAAIVTILYQMLRQPTSVVLRFAYTLHLA